MDAYTGTCIGGPDNGKIMTHWAREKKFYRPMLAFNGLGVGSLNVPVEAVEIGSYRLGDFGHWHWIETGAGRCADQ